MIAAPVSTADEAVFVEVGDLRPVDLGVGTKVVTEGGYAGRVGDTLALRGSSVIFLIGPEAHSEVEFGLLSPASYLRIHGAIAYGEPTNTWYVRVSRIESSQSILQRVMRALNERRSDPERLYRVGMAAREWAGDCRDGRLSRLADAAIIRALKLEDITLAADDWEGYFRLAEKAGALFADNVLFEFYVREGVRAYMLSSGTQRSETYFEAARLAERLLPESTLAETLLERGFVIEKGSLDPENPQAYYAIAQKALEVFGEGHRHRRLLSRAIDRERASIGRGDYRAQYLLARKVRDIHPSYAEYRVLVTQAILAEKAEMDHRDPGAWNRLGRRILFFLDDPHQAGFYFREAFRLDPSHEEAAANLRRVGLVYYNGQWWSEEELGGAALFEKARRLDELALAGRVAEGMSVEQVIRAKGQPSRTNTSAGRWGKTVQWVYDGPEGHFYVSFIADVVVSHGGF